MGNLWEVDPAYGRVITGRSKGSTRTIVVCKDATGDFVTLKDAMDAIGVDARFPAATTTNRYCIVVYPSVDGTGTTIYGENNPIVGKDYVGIEVVGRHEAARFRCLNDDDGLICGADVDYVGVHMTRTTPSAANKAGFKIPAGKADVDLHDCKASNFDALVWDDSGLMNQVRQFNVTSGSGVAIIRVTNGSMLYVVDVFCGSGATYTNCVLADGAGSAVNITAIHCFGIITNGLQVANGGEIVTSGGQVDGATNGIYALSGHIGVMGTHIHNCTNSLRVGASGEVDGSPHIEDSVTFDIITEAVGAIVKLTGAILDVSKLSIIGGSTVTFNQNPLRDTIASAQGPTGDTWIYGSYVQNLAAVPVNPVPTTQSMLTMNNHFVQVNITTLNVAGTLRITGTSYDPITGGTTPGDTEDIAIAATGWEVSSKRWDGTVTMSSVGGLDVILDGYSIEKFNNNNVGFMVSKFIAEWTPNNAVNNIRFHVERWTKALGYVTLLDVTYTNVTTLLDFSHVRDEVNWVIDSSQSPVRDQDFLLFRLRGQSIINKTRWAFFLQQED